MSDAVFNISETPCRFLLKILHTHIYIYILIFDGNTKDHMELLWHTTYASEEYLIYGLKLITMFYE